MPLQIHEEEHRAHRAQVIKDLGQWVGLLDNQGQHLIDLPPPISMVAPESRNAPSSLELTIPVKSPRGIIHPAVRELVADNLGKTTTDGTLAPVTNETRFIAIERAGVRRVYWIVYVVAKGVGAEPVTLTIHGVDLLKLLSRFPAISATTTWEGTFTRFTRDWAGPENTAVVFQQPRELAPMKMANTAHGATLEGAAEIVIRRVIKESLQTAFIAAGYRLDHPIQVLPLRSGRPSPKILFRPSDGPLWEEIAGPAAAAGVQITAFMWWPGDPQPLGLDLHLPTVVIKVEQKGTS